MRKRLSLSGCRSLKNFERRTHSAKSLTANPRSSSVRSSTLLEMAFQRQSTSARYPRHAGLAAVKANCKSAALRTWGLTAQRKKGKPEWERRASKHRITCVPHSRYTPGKLFADSSSPFQNPSHPYRRGRQVRLHFSPLTFTSTKIALTGRDDKPGSSKKTERS
jgi:hypothetical protein